MLNKGAQTTYDIDAMVFLSFIALGAVGFLFVNQFNKRLIDLKRELIDTTHELKSKVDSLEKIIRESRPSATAVTPETRTESKPFAPSPPIAQSIPSEEEAREIVQRIDEPHSVTYSSAPSDQQSKVDGWQGDDKFRRDEVYRPDALSLAFGKIKNYFTTGNTLVKVGVVLIFFGVSFLLKYAIDNDMLPIEIRLIGSALLGVGLVRLGWNLRIKSRDYGLVLQGGGIGVLILTTFVSLKSYGLISPPFAFSLLIAFTVITAILAVYQDSLNLAAFGFLGGFLAPILVSTGQGQHVVLFSYYALLNLGILYVSWKKAWRELNLLGFIFTFAIGSIWGVLKYQTDFYWSTQPFLILYFLIYIAIPLIFANKKEPELRGYVDGTIVFGNSILTLILQLQLVKEIEYAGAFSALILAAFYILLSRYLIRHRNANYRLLSEAFISIGIVFVTVAIPLAFDGMKTSAIWALEAAGIYWVALRQNRQVARYFSTFLIFATSVSFFLGPQRGASDTIFLNTFFFSCLMMAAGTYVISFLSDRHKDKISESESLVSNATFAMGSLWWVCGGLYEIDRFTFNWWFSGVNHHGISFIPYELLLNVQLVYLAIGAYLLFHVGQKLAWNKFRYFTHGFVFVLILVFLRGLSRYTHPFENFGYVSWMLAFAIYYYILFCNDKIFDIQTKLYLRLGHAGALWVMVGVLVRELNWLGNMYVGESSAWRYAAQGVVPIVVGWFVTEKKKLLPQLIQRHHSTYMYLGLAPIMMATWLWLMVTNWLNSGNAEPLPYLPLINPLELVHAGALFTMTLWIFKLRDIDWIAKSVKMKDIGIVLGATYFIWLNGVLCRALHQYVGVPFEFSSLFSSVEVQVSFSLFWTLLGIALMIYATKKQYRWLWVTGATLLGVVVCKMFLIDLSKTETMARVVSFIGVGILFLVVGYFSPIPPKAADTETKSYGK